MQVLMSHWEQVTLSECLLNVVKHSQLNLINKSNTLSGMYTFKVKLKRGQDLEFKDYQQLRLY